MTELCKFIIVVGTFLIAYFAPLGDPRVQGAILEGFHMLQEYAREHVLVGAIAGWGRTCLRTAKEIGGVTR